MKNNRDNFKPGGKKPFSRDSRDSGNNRPAGGGNFKRSSGDFKRNDGGGFKRGGGDFKRTDRPFNSDKPRFTDKTDRPDRANRAERNDRNERNDRPDRFNKPYNSNNSGKFGNKPSYSSNSFKRNDGDGGGFKRGGGDFKRNERPFNRPDRGERSERPNRPERNDRTDRNDKNDRSDNFNRFGKKPGFAKFDKPGRFERSDKKFDRKPDRFEKSERADRFNKFEKKPFQNKAEKTPDNENIGVIVSSVEQEDSGMVYGRNAVIELLKSDKSIDKLFVQSGQREGSITMIFAEAVKKSIPIIEVEKGKLDSMINNSAHQGVIALASEKEYCSVDDILQIAEDRNEKPFILIADKIMDPHNLGAIIRTAECAGVHGIVIPKRHAAGVSPIVAKTSAGASIHMAIAKVANIANTIGELKEKGVWIFSSALDLESDDNANANIQEIKDYGDADYNMPLALVVGNEGEGLSSVVIQKSDFLVRIPMLGKVESLNVSCASAVLMYEISRQRKRK